MPPLSDLTFFVGLPPDDRARVEAWLAYGNEEALPPNRVYGPVQEISLEGLYQELFRNERAQGLDNGLVSLFGELRHGYRREPTLEEMRGYVLTELHLESLMIGKIHGT